MSEHDPRTPPCPPGEVEPAGAPPTSGQGEDPGADAARSAPSGAPAGSPASPPDGPGSREGTGAPSPDPLGLGQDAGSDGGGDAGGWNAPPGWGGDGGTGGAGGGDGSGDGESGAAGDAEPGAEMTLVEHLVELRDRLLRAVLAVGVALVALVPFADRLYVLLATPLISRLPEGTTMIATEVASPFLAPFKLALMTAVAVAMPVILYQLWAFVAPGLYRHERRLVLPLLVTSTLLFYLGMAFAYYVVFPLVFAFFISYAPSGVTVMTDIGRYLDFVLKIFFAFGLAFEVPVATVLLVWSGITTPERLRAKRPYVIVGTFVIGMLLTPPDVISQTLLALPMWGLFELGLLFARFYQRDREEEQEPAAPGAD